MRVTSKTIDFCSHEKKEDTQRGKDRRYEDRDRDWGGAAMSQGIPGATEYEKGREDSSSEFVERRWHCWHL